ncbi:sensor histidine kinase [Actinomadura logoneensis]|uniref:Sensor histidine kinase n=1 Tax=Actinomadura logoneensis TaxID=2293572 RepID=A0A372JS79_9ACTN|nr:sensor histidine kinase [Actinomadura logoneensis]RFU42881.1 sensor histidine kinase [Actinomadura logoneensis]
MTGGPRRPVPAPHDAPASHDAAAPYDAAAPHAAPGPRPVPFPDDRHRRPSRDRLRHRALFYATDAEFRDAATAYLAEGAAAGDVLVVILPEPRRRLLVAALLASAARSASGAAPAPDPASGRPGGVPDIEFLDAADWYGGPTKALASFHERGRTDWWRRGRLRVLAEPPWDCRSPLELVEWQRHEALLNVVFDATSTILTCAYDIRVVPGEVLADAARTHPVFADAEGEWRNPSYADPAAFYAECNRSPLAPPPPSAAHRRFTTGQLPDVRDFLSGQAERLGLPHDRRLPFLLAANEVATAVVRHGGGSGDLWVWATADELVCELADPAARVEDRFLGHIPPRLDRPAEAAMWAVRCLCHIVEIRSDARSGTRVRLHTRLEEPPAGPPADPPSGLPTAPPPVPQGRR